MQTTNCCNNGNSASGNATVIKHVYGNEITMIIPLTRRHVELRSGTSIVSDDSQLPKLEKAVVRFSKGAIKLDFDAHIESNAVMVRDKGTIPIGTYSITVLCEDYDGRPMRFKQSTVLDVVDTTDEGGMYDPDEFDVIAYYPIINGRSSAVIIGSDDVTITEGKNFGSDDTPYDEYADINAIIGDGQVQVTDNEVILTI